MVRACDSDKGEAGVARGSLLDLIAQGAAVHADKPLAVAPQGALGYGRAHALALGLLRHLLRCAHGPGDTVLVYLANCVEMPCIMAAGQALGLRMVLRAPSLLAAHVRSDARLVGPALFIVEDDEARETVRRAGLAQEAITVSDLRELAQPVPPFGASADMGDLQPPDAARYAEVVLFTSGSTGQPKGVVNRMESFAFNAERLTAGLGVTSSDVLYAPVPVFHVYGMVSLFAALVSGATWAIMPKYSAAASLDFIRQARVSVYFCVPTMLVRELMAGAGTTCALPSVRLCMVAGDNCARDVLNSYEETVGCAVVQSYGMTETAATLTVEDPAAPRGVRHASVGRAIPGVVLATDPDTDEVLVKSPSIMTGVLTAEREPGPIVDDEGWYHTGDTGRLGADGRLHVTGRIRDIIVRGGANIFPSQVEAVYRAFPGMRDCAAVGYPDRELGERICLFAVVAPGGRVTIDEARSFAADKLEKGSLPDKVVVLEKIPVLPNGKRDSQALRDRAAAVPAHAPVLENPRSRKGCNQAVSAETCSFTS